MKYFLDREPDLILGDDRVAWFTGIYGEDDKRLGLLIQHGDAAGRSCVGSVNFDLPVVRRHFPDRAVWTVESLDPLTIHPSIRVRPCDVTGVECHGWIRNGKWVAA